MDNSDAPLEPDRVWTAEEWVDRELTAWMNMPPGEERTQAKNRAFQAAYSGGRTRFTPEGSVTGRFSTPPMPRVGDVITFNRRDLSDMDFSAVERRVQDWLRDQQA